MEFEYTQAYEKVGIGVLVWKSKIMKPYQPFFLFGSYTLKARCQTHVSYGLMPTNAECICRKVDKKLRQPALHAFILHPGTKSAWIAPPNTLTDSYIRFLTKAQPYLNLYDSEGQIQNIIYYITAVYRLNTFVSSLRYLITLLKYTLLYYIVEFNSKKITLLSYTLS